MPTLALPLAFVIIVNACKDGFEDWRRHKADRLENQTVAIGILTKAELEYRTLHPKVVYPDERYANDYMDDEMEMEDPTVLLGTAVMEQRSQIMGDEFDFLQSVEATLEESITPEFDEDELMDSDILMVKPWQDIRVGDLIVCRNKDRFPADLVLLATSDPMGIAFIDTASLDGETNLKVRQARAETVELLGTDAEETFRLFQKLVGSLECSPPDANLNYFDGNIEFGIEGKTIKEDMKKLPLTANQLLLRGCRLRNTAWVIGIVVYTGRETKIQMNGSDSPHKTSRIERYTNILTLIIFGLQLVICFIGAGATAVIATRQKYLDMGYLDLNEQSAALTAFTRVFTWIVLFVNMIPISLIVTMGMVKAAQAVLIGLDNDMYYSATKTFASARTSELNEELGQVQHVFTDKTGTLTCNCMEFRKCCIRGVNYGQGLTEIRRNVLRRQGIAASADPKPDPSEPITPNVNFVDSSLRQQLKDVNHPQYPYLLDFLVHLSVNQAVVAENSADGKVFYSASSPDEGALTYGSAHFGVKFISRNSDGVKLEVFGRQINVEILACVEFTSSRKRSSVLCHFPSTNESFGDPITDELLSSGRYVLYCKGADSVIVERLDGKGELPEDTESILMMERYAQDGLRTLCVAKRELQQDVVMKWYEAYEVACLTTINRQEKIEAAAESLEKDLQLQGVTGIEDKLQDGVGDTLEALAQAGIRIWMLTGDKVETAINIGIATSLLDPKGMQFIYQWDALEEKTSGTSAVVASLIDTALDISPDQGFAMPQAKQGKLLLSRIEDDLSRLSVSKPSRKTAKSKFHENVRRFGYAFSLSTVPPITHPAQRDAASKPNASVIIDGDCLAEVLKSDLKDKFLELCLGCKAVICCRVTPYQKGAIVTMVKHRQGSVTLAIGDGANDCNMIQSADVGVGLRGAEGMQAFNVSDYGISQFRFLKVLLLCHGRWCYRRLSRLVLYMFYKNLVVVLPIFYFAFYSLFSGQKIYHELLYQLYNVILTSIPVMIFGIFDQDINKQLSLAFPQLYRLGHHNFHFNTGIFCRWILNGFIQSVFVFSVPLIAFDGGKVMANGLPSSFWFAGHVTFLLVMIVVNVKILLESALLTWMMWLGVICSLFAWFLSMFLFTSWPKLAPDLIGMMISMLRNPLWYIIVIGTPIICLSWDFLWKTIRATFIPELYHLVVQTTQHLSEIQEFPALLVRTSLRGVEKMDHFAPLEDVTPITVAERTRSTENPDPVSPTKSIRKNEIQLTQLQRSATSRGYAFSEADAKAVSFLVASPVYSPQETNLETLLESSSPPFS